MGALSKVLKKKRLGESERQELLNKLKELGVVLDTEHFIISGGSVGVYLMSKSNAERLLTLLDYIIKQLEQARDEEAEESKT
ncbi:MAG TPA: hypothetical protein ENO30_05555 [Thermodesulfobium narugense]|nr:hypothetical protein [Thermodesulfobium narugense]